MVSEVHSLTKSALRHSPFNIFFFPMRGCASRVARGGKNQSFWPFRPASKSRRAIGPAVSLCRSAAGRENDDPHRANDWQ
jgi:hypothetical protein